jgi:ribosome-associated heat shock protein Hsp15
MNGVRIDKWLWAARFYKTRTLASDEIGKGRVELNGHTAKPAHDLKVGDTVMLRHGDIIRTVVVQALSGQRGSATLARQLYEETADSLQRREQLAEQSRYAPEPALSMEQGRPTKRGRRELDDARRGWDQRWSASTDGGGKH